MKGYYAIYNHRTNEWYSHGGYWLEDSNTEKDVYNIQIFQTLAEAEGRLYSGNIYKNNSKDFFTIRKIYF
jgi:hypothetical protein